MLRKASWLRILKLLLPLAVAAGCGRAESAPQAADRAPSTAVTVVAQNAPRSRPGQIVALGRIEPAGGLVYLHALPGDRIEEITAQADPNVLVESGTRLVLLESHMLRSLDLESAQQQRREAEARKEAEENHADRLIEEAKLAIQAVALSDHDIRSSDAQITVLEGQLALAQNDWKRIQGVSRTVVSDSQRDQAELMVTKAKAELAAARETREKLVAAQKLSLEQAEAQLAAAQAARAKIAATIPLGALELGEKLARERLKSSELRAPFEGHVVKVFAHRGDSTGATPILAMGDLRQMAVVAEVYESDVQFVRPGDAATIQSYALERDLKGTVRQVGTLVGRNQVTSLDPTARSDLRVVEVKISIDEPADAQLAARFVNLQVDVRITSQQASAAQQVPGGDAQASFDR